MEVGDLAIDLASWRAGCITALGDDGTTAWLDPYAKYRIDENGKETLNRIAEVERDRRTRVADLRVLTLDEWTKMWMESERDLWRLLDSRLRPPEKLR